VIEGLAVFEVEDVPAPLCELDQLRGIRENQLPGQWRLQVLFEELAMPTGTPHEVEVNLPLPLPISLTSLAQAFPRRM
jgi:hypothetical protein